MNTQREDKQQELMDAVTDQIRALLEETGSIHPEKRDHLYTTLCQIQVVLTKEIEFCRTPYFRGAYG